MNLVVLCGGAETARTLSLTEAQALTKTLRALGHRVCPLDIQRGCSVLPDPMEKAFSITDSPLDAAIAEIIPTGQPPHKPPPRLGEQVLTLCRAADLVFLSLKGGDGESGRVQSLFDMLDIRYTGSAPFGAALSMDKWISKQLLCNAGIPVAEGFLLKESELHDLGELHLPCVIKPRRGNSGLGVSIARDAQSLATALCEGFTEERELLLEDCIEGRELSCCILGSQVLPLVEIQPDAGHYDYAHRLNPSRTKLTAPARIGRELTKVVQELSLSACRTLGLSIYARIDWMLDGKGQFHCLEGNALPALSPTGIFAAAAWAGGLDYETLIETVINRSMEKYNR